MSARTRQESPIKRDIKISRGTHLMHLEIMRTALYHETNAFLLGEGRAHSPHRRSGEIADRIAAVPL
jgi:hypothetical protein